jgi:hypothetical protein
MKIRKFLVKSILSWWTFVNDSGSGDIVTS